MVTQAYLGEEEYSFRRLSRAGQSYATLQDRPYPPPGVDNNHRGFSVSSHGSRGSDHDASQEANGPRRRIPVACGRCRKRKIRCSGEPKGGGPCTNCKNAGSDVCQFLRVSSTETPMKVELADVSFENVGTRIQLPVRSVIPYGNYNNHPYSQQILGPDGNWSAYRTSSVSGYPYSVKSHHGLPSYHAEFSEVDGSNVDYNVPNPNVPLMNSEYMNVQSYGGRGWMHPNKNGLMYQEANSQNNYSHEHPTYHHGYALRPTTSPEGKSYSMASMQASLPVPTQIAGNDRVLPYPAVNRPLQSTETYLRSSDVLPSSQSGAQSYSGLNVLTASALKPVHSSSVSESNYIPMSNSPDSSSSHIGYGGANMSVNQQHGDMYTSTNENGLFHGQAMRSNSGVDVDYNYGPDVSASSKRGSQSSGGELVNGHPYIPHNHGQQGTFPTPSPPLAQPLPHRTSSSSLHAVGCTQ